MIDVVDEDIEVYRIAPKSPPEVSRLGDDKRRALADLGVRPSSINSSNTLIWVEGPSDAIYLRMWFNLLGFDLVEGYDFAFAILGGSVLAHLAQQPGEYGQEVVDPLRVNLNSVLVVDRDAKPGEIGKTYVARIMDELEDRIWVTDGREIESYLPDSLLKAADGQDVSLTIDVEQPSRTFDTRLRDLDLHAANRGPNKVSWALKVRAAVEDADVADVVPDDLDTWLNGLRDRIVQHRDAS